MRILVTGASGFLGTALCRFLVGRGDHVTGMSRASSDLTQGGTLDRYSQERYERIYHLAAWTRAGDFCLHHQGEQWLINQRINTNVLGWWAEHQPQATMIAIGTSCAYSPDAPLTEDQYLNGAPTDDLFSYAMTKRMMYAGLLSLHKQYDLRYLQLIPATLYGPAYHNDGRQMHFIFDLIWKVLRGKMYGEPVILWGDGEQRRELLFLDDFVESLVRIPDVCSNENVNVGPGMEHSIRHYAEMICSEVGYDIADIHFDRNRYVGVRSKCLSTAKLHRLLPNLRLTPLDDGLSATIQWAMRTLVDKPTHQLGS